MMNSATAPWNDARGPKRPISQAFSSIDTVIADRKPLDIQCAWSWPIPKAPMMSGIATFTIVDDMTIEIMAIIVVTVTASLLIAGGAAGGRSEEHTSELQSLMRISYAVFWLKNKK